MLGWLLSGERGTHTPPPDTSLAELTRGQTDRVDGGVVHAGGEMSSAGR